MEFTVGWKSKEHAYMSYKGFEDAMRGCQYYEIPNEIIDLELRSAWQFGHSLYTQYGIKSYIKWILKEINRSYKCLY